MLFRSYPAIYTHSSHLIDQSQTQFSVGVASAVSSRSRSFQWVRCDCEVFVFIKWNGFESGNGVGALHRHIVSLSHRHIVTLPHRLINRLLTQKLSGSASQRLSFSAASSQFEAIHVTFYLSFSGTTVAQPWQNTEVNRKMTAR